MQIDDQCGTVVVMLSFFSGRNRLTGAAAVAAVFLLGLGTGACGDTTPEGEGEEKRVFSYRGRERIGIRMVGGVPGGVRSGGVEVQVAGIMVQGRDLSYNFGIACERRPVGVVVEDATAATVIRLVEQFPTEGVKLGEDGRWTWFGQGGRTVVEPKTVPWAMAEGETSFVFRIFVETEDGERVEVYQPAVFGEAFKTELRKRMSEGGEVDSREGKVSGGRGGSSEEDKKSQKNP